MSKDRVPLDLAPIICGVQLRTIYRWVREGRITRHWNGFDFHELIAVRDGRDLDALLSRAGVKHADRKQTA